MTHRPDQLDMQLHLEIHAIRQQAHAIRQRIHTWKPRPYPTRSTR